MINIQTRKQNNTYEIVLSGHADYAPHGKDIVCSAVSVLVYTLAECADRHGCKWIERKLSEGQTGLVFEYPPGMETVIDTVETGFTLLASDYKECVNFSPN